MKRYAWSLPYLILGAICLLPLIFLRNRLSIGGDVIVPLTADSLYKYLFHWVEISGGKYFAINYYPYYIFLSLSQRLDLDIYFMGSSLLVILNIVCCIGVIRLCRLIFPNGARSTEVLAAAIYLLSPARLNAPHFSFAYALAPWIIFPFIKFYVKKKIEISDLLLLGVVVFVGSMELPNPKYLFYTHFVGLVVIAVGLIRKRFGLKELFNAIPKILLYMALTVYIWLPQLIFATHYRADNYDVRVQGSDSRKGMANAGIDTADRIFNLHQDYVFLNRNDAINYNNNPLIRGSNFILAIFVFVTFFFNRFNYKKKIDELYLLQWLIVVYLFFSLGPNFPFGDIYWHIVAKVPLLAFLRTTAGAVFYLSLFYALTIHWLLESKKKWSGHIYLVLIVVLAIVGSPFLTGKYYRNFNDINPNTPINESGYKIPQDYLKVYDFVSSQKLDAKTVVINSSLTYLNTKWGYFGPVLYNFLYTGRYIGSGDIKGKPSDLNIGFELEDRYLISENGSQKSESTEVEGGGDQIILKPIEATLIKPHLYSQDKLTIEYRKINPTKYLIRVHATMPKFTIQLLEAFHPLWSLRLLPIQKRDDTLATDTLSSDYKILESNQAMQAGADELSAMIKSGTVTSLGSLGDKEINHYKWIGGKRVLDHIEKFKIDFISKQLNSTVQNQNLPLPGLLVQHTRTEKISDSLHLENGLYGNLWNLDFSNLCSENQSTYCKNNDGKFEFDLLLEFKPQIIYELSMLLSIVTWVVSCTYLLIYRQ